MRRRWWPALIQRMSAFTTLNWMSTTISEERENANYGDPAARWHVTRNGWRLIPGDENAAHYPRELAWHGANDAAEPANRVETRKTFSFDRQGGSRHGGRAGPGVPLCRWRPLRIHAPDHLRTDDAHQRFAGRQSLVPRAQYACHDRYV